MADIDQLVEKFRSKLIKTQEIEKYKNEIAIPFINKIFNEEFAKIFQNLIEEINSKVGSKVLSFQEGRNNFIIEGQYHRIHFQKGKIDLLDQLAVAHIIPIYVWKGVTKHLGPISFIANPETQEVKWDIPLESIEAYSKNLFSKLVDDEDFSM